MKLYTFTLFISPVMEFVKDKVAKEFTTFSASNIVLNSKFQFERGIVYVYPKSARKCNIIFNNNGVNMQAAIKSFLCIIFILKILIMLTKCLIFHVKTSNPLIFKN